MKQNKIIIIMRRKSLESMMIKVRMIVSHATLNLIFSDALKLRFCIKLTI